MDDLHIDYNSSGQPYIAVPLPSDLALRLTYLTHEGGWIDATSIRIQVDQNGHLRQGPEISADAVVPMCEAALKLARLQPDREE